MELQMTRAEIQSALIDIINNILPEGDCSGIDPAGKLRDQLELDSMDFLDIVMELRKQYKVQIPEADYPQMATMNGCLDYLEPKMKDL